jgi:hypothetical protein
MSRLNLLQANASVVVCYCMRVVIVREHSFLKVVIVRTLFSDRRRLRILYVRCQSAGRSEVGIELGLIAWLDRFWTRVSLRYLVSAVYRVSRPSYVLLPGLEFAQLARLELVGFLNTPLAGQSIIRLCPHHLTLTESNSLEWLLLFF